MRGDHHLGGGDAVGHLADDVGKAATVHFGEAAVTQMLGPQRRQRANHARTGTADRQLATKADADRAVFAFHHDAGFATPARGLGQSRRRKARRFGGVSGPDQVGG